MALLSRRAIQRLIDEAPGYLTPEQLIELVRRLNSKKSDAFAAEWELIILHSLARLGKLSYEPLIVGSRRPDFLLKLGTCLELVADIVTVSDDYQHKLNPLEAFQNEFNRQTERVRINGIIGGFFTTIRPRPSGNRSKGKPPQIAVPQKQELGRYVFNDAFQDFVTKIISDPTTIHILDVVDGPADLTVEFSPKRRHTMMGFPGFTLPVDRRRNPVYNALRAKRQQLRDALGDSSVVVRGIILCDGGCSLFGHSGFATTYSFTQVVEEFLRRTGSVDFVLGVDVLERDTFGPSRGRRFRTRLFTKRSLECVGALQAAFDTGFSELPRPINNVMNARRRLTELQSADLASRRDYRSGHILHLHSEEDEFGVEVSAKAIIDLVTGRLSRAQFEYLVLPEAVQNLRSAMSQGLAIASIDFVGSRDHDDDRVVINFNGRDPAMNEFQVPNYLIKE